MTFQLLWEYFFIFYAVNLQWDKEAGPLPRYSQKQRASLPYTSLTVHTIQDCSALAQSKLLYVMDFWLPTDGIL